MAEKKESVTDLRGKEIARLKKELKIGKHDVLKCDDVVKGARSKTKYPNLHSRFEWDDTKAAQLHRLRQARELLVEVRVEIPDRPDIKVQGFVSLPSDQKMPGGGYRETVSVLSDRELREELLEQAWREFEYWQEKYACFKELGPIFDAAKKARNQKTKPKTKKPRQSKKEQTNED